MKLELSQLKTQLANTTAHNTSLEGANLSIHSELVDVKTVTVNRLQSTVTSLQEQIENRDKQISDLRDSSDALQSQLDQVSSQNNDLKVGNNLLESTLKARDKTIANLNNQNSQGNEVNKKLEDSISSLNIQLTQAITTNNQLDQQVTYLRNAVDTKNLELSELRDELETLKNPLLGDTPVVSHVSRRLNFNTTIISPLRGRNLTSPRTAIQQSPSRMPNKPPTGLAAQNARAAPDIATPLVEKLKELFSREEKKTIPIYKGKSTDKLVTDWLKDAERVARNNNWTPDQKIRFFSDRLGGEALDWHMEYVDNRPTLNFPDWKRDFIARFRDEADIDKLKNKLQTLKQKPEQRTRAFIAKINDLFDSIHGKERPLPDANAVNQPTARERELYEDNQKIRNDIKKKILLKGLLPKIKNEIWPRMERDDTSTKSVNMLIQQKGS